MHDHRAVLTEAGVGEAANLGFSPELGSPRSDL